MATSIAPGPVPLDAKKAVEIAFAYFRELFGAKLAKPNLMLEELEETEDGKHWLVTLGYDVASRRKVENVFGGPLREYKTFTIDARSGRVTAAKIRNV